MKNFKMVAILNRRILAILNFHIIPMPPIMFTLNQTYPLVADVISRFFKMAAMVAILDIRTESSNSKSPCCQRCCSKIFKKADNFSNSESLCRFYASNPVLTQSDLWFGRRCRLKNFKMATMVAILDI